MPLKLLFFFWLCPWLKWRAGVIDDFPLITLWTQHKMRIVPRFNFQLSPCKTSSVSEEQWQLLKIDILSFSLRLIHAHSSFFSGNYKEPWTNGMVCICTNLCNLFKLTHASSHIPKLSNKMILCHCIHTYVLCIWNIFDSNIKQSNLFLHSK